MSDGTNSKSWQKFVSELAKEDVDFASIKHADEATRQQLLASLSGLTALDRAAITTTWKRLVINQPDGRSSESSAINSQEPPPMHSANRGGSLPRGGSSPQMQPSSGAYGRASPMGRGSRSLAQDNSAIFGQNTQSQYFDSQQDFSRGSPMTAAKAQPALLVPLNQNNDQMANNANALAQLRESLQRGDCATSLPLASELLHNDPIQLIHLLHHFLPQVSIEQLKVILGVGSDNALKEVPNFSPPVKNNNNNTSSNYMPRASQGSPRTPYNAYSPTSRQGGSRGSYQPPSQNAFDSYNEDVEMTAQATMNGQPVSVGQVLTSNQVQSQYGMRFTAMCNGQVMKFPHMVARGDRIMIRPATDRLL